MGYPIRMSELQLHLSTLAEPVRVRLLAVLEQEEMGVGELTRILQLPQSTVSRHLKALQTAGWVRRRSEGTSSWYRMDATVPPSAHQVWAVVQADFAASHTFDEDRARAAVALAARRMDSQTFFGQMHDQWDQLRTELFGSAFALPTLLSLLPGDLTVADLGCGTGEALGWLAPVVTRVIGVDREQRMLDAAAERTRALDNVDLRLGGLESLPLGDGEVDAVLVMLVLHHVPDLNRAFQELRRVLRRGGTAVILDMQAHDRESYQLAMGHAHLGFEVDKLSELAKTVDLATIAHRTLTPDPDANGPPLFLLSLRG
jgi:ubiquinone/menaquinone biosynthesis C-methylase UbiE/DNA-binding transcriptional ArsR family regulator